MREIIKSLIETIEPEFHSESSFTSLPLPSEVTLYLENDTHFIDICFGVEGVLEVGIWIGDEQYDADDDLLNYIYDYCEFLLTEEVDTTKEHYENEIYNQNSHSYYIR
tara:strand:+ start:517 stop:840 length:324 start_codon:yes stop_codon:yes gene_type:complete